MEVALSTSAGLHWRRALDDELASLQAMGTRVVGPLPAGVKPIHVKWVFKTKRDSNGNIERYKARLVAKGFAQRPGIDYDEVFAPTSKYTTLRALLAKTASEQLLLHQVDIKTAFLNGQLGKDEDIWIAQPPCYPLGPPGTACHLPLWY